MNSGEIESEKRLELALKLRVRRLGCICLKLLPSITGLPDRIIIMPNGKVAFAEMKTTKETLKPIQKYWQEKLRRFGFICEKVDSSRALDDFIRLVRNELDTSTGAGLSL